MPAHSSTRRRHHGADGLRQPVLRRDLRAAELEEHVQRIVDSALPLPAEQRERIATLLHPPASSTAQYVQVQQDFEERTMRRTEKQFDHQIRLEQRELELREEIVDAEIRSFARAQWFTFVLVVVFLALAGVGLFRGQALGAAAAGLAALAAMANAFLGRGGRSKSESVNRPGCVSVRQRGAHTYQRIGYRDHLREEAKP
jgi:hypothetical protein